MKTYALNHRFGELIRDWRVLADALDADAYRTQREYGDLMAAGWQHSMHGKADGLRMAADALEKSGLTDPAHQG